MHATEPSILLLICVIAACYTHGGNVCVCLTGTTTTATNDGRRRRRRRRQRPLRVYALVFKMHTHQSLASARDKHAQKPSPQIELWASQLAHTHAHTRAHTRSIHHHHHHHSTHSPLSTWRIGLISGWLCCCCCCYVMRLVTAINR